jgi:hypothetical protein
MQRQRHNAPGGAQHLGRVGALGVVAAGALCAAVLSVASRVPPTPIDTERIPGIEIGPALEGDVTPAVRSDRGSSSRDGARGSDARGRGDSPRGRAVPAAYGRSGGAAGQNVAGGPRSGDGARDEPVSGTRPGDGDGGGPSPGPRNDGGGNRRSPGTGGGNDNDRAAPRRGPAPAPAPAPAPTPAPAPAAAATGGAAEPADTESTGTEPADTEPADADEDAAPAPLATTARNDADEVEVETEPAPAAANPAPTQDGSDDLDG